MHWHPRSPNFHSFINDWLQTFQTFVSTQFFARPTASLHETGTISLSISGALLRQRLHPSPCSGRLTPTTIISLKFNHIARPTFQRHRQSTCTRRIAIRGRQKCNYTRHTIHHYICIPLRTISICIMNTNRRCCRNCTRDILKCQCPAWRAADVSDRFGAGAAGAGLDYGAVGKNVGG